MLVHDGRYEMALRAVQSFRRQSYRKSSLLIFDNSKSPDDPLRLKLAGAADWYEYEAGKWEENYGYLRNRANSIAKGTFDPEFIAHWDSDDWYAVDRIGSQVAYLATVPRIECTGFHSLVFWDQRNPGGAEAWRYTHPDPRYCAGSSMLYRVGAWARHEFDSFGRGEDLRWQRSTSRFAAPDMGAGGPLMIAGIHAGNGSNSAYNPEKMADSMCWRPAPEWQGYCKTRMVID